MLFCSGAVRVGGVLQRVWRDDKLAPPVQGRINKSGQCSQATRSSTLTIFINAARITRVDVTALVPSSEVLVAIATGCSTCTFLSRIVPVVADDGLGTDVALRRTLSSECHIGVTMPGTTRRSSSGQLQCK